MSILLVFSMCNNMSKYSTQLGGNYNSVQVTMSNNKVVTLWVVWLCL